MILKLWSLALYPALTDIEVPIIFYLAILDSAEVFKIFNFRLASIYIAMHMMEEEQQSSRLYRICTESEAVSGNVSASNPSIIIKRNKGSQEFLFLGLISSHLICSHLCQSPKVVFLHLPLPSCCPEPALFVLPFIPFGHPQQKGLQGVIIWLCTKWQNWLKQYRTLLVTSLVAVYL